MSYKAYPAPKQSVTGSSPNKIRNRKQRHETAESSGNQPAGRNRNQRTPVTEPRRHATETGAITQGFFCIEDIAIVITGSFKHVFCRQTQCLQGC